MSVKEDRPDGHIRLVGYQFDYFDSKTRSKTIWCYNADKLTSDTVWLFGKLSLYNCSLPLDSHRQRQL